MTEAAASTKTRYPTRFERTILKRGGVWLKGILSAEDAPPLAELPRFAKRAARRGAASRNGNDPRLILLCMTPRSGSTALSGALDSTKLLGRGSGERLNHKNAALNDIAIHLRPRTRRELLEHVIDASRTRNGVGQIKCDLPQLLPFLLDPGCQEILLKARFVYLTRGDLLGQAISRYRSQKAGVTHARGTAPADKEAEYSYDAIDLQLDYLSRMMASYEKTFAMLGIQPMRITYEQITAAPGQTVSDIARLVDVDIDAGAISGLDAGGYRKVSGMNNDRLRELFLAEASTRVSIPEHRAGRGTRPARDVSDRNQ